MTMPWHDPGRLSDEEYWQLTPFLLRENSVAVGQEPLGPAEPTRLPEDTPGSQAAGEPPGATPSHGSAGELSRSVVEPALLTGLGLLAGLALAWGIVKARRQKEG